MRDKVDVLMLLMAGYIGLVIGLISLIAVSCIVICPGWDPLEGNGSVPANLFFGATPAAVFLVSGWISGRLWRSRGGIAVWIESILATPSTWAAPALYLILGSLQVELEAGPWLWLIWFLPAYAATYLGLWSKPNRRPGHCARCGYDLTGNASGRCPECGTQTSR